MTLSFRTFGRLVKGAQAGSQHFFSNLVLISYARERQRRGGAESGVGVAPEGRLTVILGLLRPKAMIPCAQDDRAEGPGIQPREQRENRVHDLFRAGLIRSTICTTRW